MGVFAFGVEFKQRHKPGDQHKHFAFAFAWPVKQQQQFHKHSRMQMSWRFSLISSFKNQKSIKKQKIFRFF